MFLLSSMRGTNAGTLEKGNSRGSGGKPLLLSHLYAREAARGSNPSLKLSELNSSSKRDSLELPRPIALLLKKPPKTPHFQHSKSQPPLLKLLSSVPPLLKPKGYAMFLPTVAKTKKRKMFSGELVA